MDRRNREGAWLLFSGVAVFAALPLAFAASRAVLATGLAGSGTGIQEHRLGLSIAMLLFGVIGVASILILHRTLIGPIRRGQLRSAILAASAAGIAGWIGELAIVGWGIERFGEQGADPDLLREATFLPVLTVVAGLSGSMRGLSTRGTPRRLMTTVTVAIAGVVLALLLLNVPGAFDGIGPGGTQLGMGLAAMAVVVLGIAVAALRSPESQDPERKTSPLPGD